MKEARCICGRKMRFRDGAWICSKEDCPYNIVELTIVDEI